ncbi:hypothetical protein [Peptostreptococcus faecalis]|uniref:hypothetical protein n=1 Tax=Peptostreptococcus faecalis TaxID=2045015 RepID=UPI000C7A33EA|nr:hypothetical protein [Peptostreptococcus faecalis]
MGEKNKKANSGKTINFAEKKKAYINNKQTQNNTQKNTYNDNIVIQYDINKMREQINQQTKNKKAFESKLKKKFWVKLIYFILVGSIVILIAAKLTNNFTFSSTSDVPGKFVEESTVLDSDSKLKYEQLIDEKLNELVANNGQLSVSTEEIHKNSKIIYASGYFSYPEESSKIAFDSIIESDKLISLVVNGHELIKK